MSENCMMRLQSVVGGLDPLERRKQVDYTYYFVCDKDHVHKTGDGKLQPKGGYFIGVGTFWGEQQPGLDRDWPHWGDYPTQPKDPVETAREGIRRFLGDEAVRYFDLALAVARDPSRAARYGQQPDFGKYVSKYTKVAVDLAVKSLIGGRK